MSKCQAGTHITIERDGREIDVLVNGFVILEEGQVVDAEFTDAHDDNGEIKLTESEIDTATDELMGSYDNHLEDGEEFPEHGYDHD